MKKVIILIKFEDISLIAFYNNKSLFKILFQYMKNITNGEIQLNYDPEDKVPNDYKFVRAPNFDSLQLLKRQIPNQQTSYFIENIRSGSFSQISQTYMMQSAKQKQDHQHFTIDSFDTEMKVLMIQFQNKLFKATTFFQGIFAGMALLFTITLNLSSSVSTQLVRVQDQTIRVFSLLSTLGAFYSMVISYEKYSNGKLRGSAAQIDQQYKSLVLCILELIFYLISYIIFNISHKSAVIYNINGTNYTDLSNLTTAYTIICLIGWIITNTNTYKYQNN